jgi:hypothetical protein
MWARFVDCRHRRAFRYWSPNPLPGRRVSWWGTAASNDLFHKEEIHFRPELYIVTWSRLQPKRKSYFLSVQLRVSLPRYVAIRHVYIPYKLSSRPRESLGVKCGRRSSLNLHSSFVLPDPQPLSASRKPQAESSLLVHERLLVERLHHHLIQSHFT